MVDALFCEPLRTPVGGLGGGLRDVPAQDLASAVLRELVARTAITSDEVDDVVFGHCYPTMDAPAIGRVAALDAGLEITVPGIQIDRRCGSGLQAVLYAAMTVQTGGASLVLAGGAESMSRAAHYSHQPRWGVKAGSLEFKDSLAAGRTTAGGLNHPVAGGMLETAENVRRDYGVARAEQDELAVASHARAAARIVTTPARAEQLSLRPLVRLVSWGLAWVAPKTMGIGPVPATETALGRTGLRLDDLEVIELNEAFASQTLAVTREWGLDPASDDRFNPNGSGISLGHPVGATGTRILATLAREMQRREARYGLETMCIGGGQGLAAVFERVA